MAGHSKFKNIMHRKGAQDAKRAKMFTKVTREIISAVKTGNSDDPGMNPRLRGAIQWARKENLPRDRIEAAIKRGSGASDGDNFEAIRYEGYGPGGVAIIVEALTDNKNRSASDIRSAFTKHSGNMGETGSVSYMFDQVGVITYPAAKASEEAMLDAAIEAGADNCELADGAHSITCSVDQFAAVRDHLETQFGEAESAKLSWLEKTPTAVNDIHAQTIMKLLDALEDNDDVQEVFSNADFTDEQIANFNG